MSLQDKIEDGFPTQDEIDERLNRDPRFAQGINQTTHWQIEDCLTWKSNKTSWSTEQPEDKE